MSEQESASGAGVSRDDRRPVTDVDSVEAATPVPGANIRYYGELRLTLDCTRAVAQAAFDAFPAAVTACENHMWTLNVQDIDLALTLGKYHQELMFTCSFDIGDANDEPCWWAMYYTEVAVWTIMGNLKESIGPWTVVDGDVRVGHKFAADDLDRLNSSHTVL